MYLILICTNMFTYEQDIPIVYIEYTSMALEQRLHFHLYQSSQDNPVSEFHKALKYVGTKYFRWEVLDSTETEEEALELVKYYIHEYKSDSMGYNKPIDEDREGKNNPQYGDHRTYEEKFGKEKAEAIRKKQSESNRSKEIAPAFLRTGKYNTFYGKKHTPETKKILSEKTSQIVKGAGNPMYGKTHTEETRKKIGEKSKGRKRTKEVYEKYSNKVYTILDECGNMTETKVLTIWCKEHDIDYANMRYHMRKQEYYKGYKIGEKL